eukprot:TRINITY_DN8448_c0_g1_i1.p1 TRINITY_DN8448_c0_g1~~TRINITY_DN8448_c0_g1_i1.p1  ORF type:complete len:243 (-),score=6.11 TRINITY_DN8448_c0_g1_i1:258-878(-)
MSRSRPRDSQSLQPLMASSTDRSRLEDIEKARDLLYDSQLFRYSGGSASLFLLGTCLAHGFIHFISVPHTAGFALSPLFILMSWIQFGIMLLCAGLISLTSYISLSRFRPLLLFTVAYCIIVSLLCIGMSALTFLWWVDLPGVILGYAIISTYGVLLAVDVVPLVMYVVFALRFHRQHAVETVQVSFKELDKKKALRNRARRYSPR